MANRRFLYVVITVLHLGTLFFTGLTVRRLFPVMNNDGILLICLILAIFLLTLIRERLSQLR